MTIYHINPKETITSILTEVQRSQEDLLRKRALRMFSQMKSIYPPIMFSFQDFYVVELLS